MTTKKQKLSKEGQKIVEEVDALIKKSEETMFWEQLGQELIELFNILRDGEYQEICIASNHSLMLCTTCNADIDDLRSRIKKHKANGLIPLKSRYLSD